MDEDEEVDVLGSYDDISKISSGQLLSCEYTVHPNWVNENAEGGNFWSDCVPKHENLESNVQVLQSEEVVIKEPEPVPTIIELDWNREGSAQDDLIFEEDIPAAIEEVVEEIACSSIATTATESDQCINYEEQQSDGWELAAFETHPPPKNVKYIGPTNPRSLLKVKMESQVESNEIIERSTNIRNINTIEKPVKKFTQTLLVRQNVLVSKNLPKIPTISQTKKKETQYNECIKRKFKQTLSMTPSSFTNGKLQFPKKLKETKLLGRIRGKSKKHKYNSNHFGENITISHELEQKQVELMPSETVVKLKACDTDSDVDIDIEIDTSNDEKTLKVIDNMAIIVETKSDSNQISTNSSSDKTQSMQIPEEELSDELKIQLTDMSVPTEETYINPMEISPLEKYVHSDFFKNKIRKTPERYLRIRNHILSMWNNSKLNYISKTRVRSGLAQAGDVNCIGRIHRYLEQIGAINFGYQGVHFEFVRPLKDFVSTLILPPRNRTSSNSCTLNLLSIESRQRIRLNSSNSSLIDHYTHHDANYTISHMEGVARPDPPALNSNRNIIPSYANHIKSELDLVKCLKFSKEKIAPFKVSITLSTLLCLRLHSLSSDYEVMGFIGGHRSKSVGRIKLSLTRYKPCRTSQQSGTMCEMCPVSQVEQSSSLRSDGFELLGWFHSHPLFPPNPSRTDVQTQKDMQLQFSFDDRPLVGMILSCLNMALKCMYIMPKDLHSYVNDNGLPYELDVDIIKDCTDFKKDVEDVLYLIRKNCDFPLEIIEKFKLSSHAILKQFGYNENTFFDGLFHK